MGYHHDMTTRNHAAWIGPLLAVVGLVSYFTVFVRFAWTRDTAAVNLALVVIGLGLSLWAVSRRRSWRTWLGLTASAVCATLLASYVYGLSSDVPAADLAVPVGAQAPPLVLPDHTGAEFDLAAQSGRTLVVFYRGFW